MDIIEELKNRISHLNYSVEKEEGWESVRIFSNKKPIITLVLIRIIQNEFKGRISLDGIKYNQNKNRLECIGWIKRSKNGTLIHQTM